MPRSISLFSITLRRTTTIFMVNGNLRHIDGSTTITNRNTFNIENTISEPLAQSSPAVSLIVGNDGKVVFWVLKASWALIYNDLIQLQPPWYLQILQPRLKHMIRAGLQVRDKFRYTFEIITHKSTLSYIYNKFYGQPVVCNFRKFRNVPRELLRLLASKNILGVLRNKFKMASSKWHGPVLLRYLFY